MGPSPCGESCKVGEPKLFGHTDYMTIRVWKHCSSGGQDGWITSLLLRRGGGSGFLTRLEWRDPDSCPCELKCGATVYLVITCGRWGSPK